MLVLFQVSCAPNNSGNYAEARSDLNKLANVVDSFSIPSTEAPQTSQKPTYKNVSQDNIYENEYTDERGDHRYTHEYFELDGVTPISSYDAFTAESYIVNQVSNFKNSQYESVFSASITVTNSAVSDNPDMVIRGFGNVNYYNYDLLFKADSLFASFLRYLSII